MNSELKLQASKLEEVSERRKRIRQSAIIFFDLIQDIEDILQ